MQFSLNLYASNFFVGAETKKLFCITFLIILFYRHINFRENLHFCLQNTKSFPTSDILKYHLRVHSERRFRCSLFDKSFKDSSRIRIHIRAHTWEKPFFDQNLFQDMTSESTFKNSCRRETVHMYSLSDVFCTTWLSESTFKKSYRTENFSCPLCDNSFRESPSRKKKKNIPLYQFKHDIAFCTWRPVCWNRMLLLRGAWSNWKKRLVTVRRVIILLNFSRHPSLICLRWMWWWGRLYSSCADLLQEFKKVCWRLLVVSSFFNNFLG